MESIKIIVKLAVSAAMVYIVSEIVVRHSRPWLGSLVASLPLLAVLTFFWIYYGIEDSTDRVEKLAQHSTGVFWWVLPSLPMFLIFPWLLRRGVPFWPNIILCCLITMCLYALLALTMLSGFAEEVVNLYSYRHYDADTALFNQFTEKTGIKVNVVKSKADALIERLKSEGRQSTADLLVTSDAARLVKAKDLGLLQAGGSDTLTKQVPAKLRDSENYWYGMTVRARVIVYAKDRVKPGEFKTYADLTKPEWKGRVLVRSASNIYNQSLLASIIANQGEKEALLWAMGVRKNMARDPQGSDRSQVKAVASGVGDVAIVNTYYLGLMANSKDPKDVEAAAKVAICFPNQETTGTHINISGSGICKYAPNKANAIKLLEFLSSPEIQETFPNTTFEFPLSMESSSPLLKSWGSFKADDLKLEELGKYNAKAAQLFVAAKWE